MSLDIRQNKRRGVIESDKLYKSVFKKYLEFSGKPIKEKCFLVNSKKGVTYLANLKQLGKHKS